MHKIGLIFTVSFLVFHVALAQQKLKDPLKKPLQQAIQNHINKEKESIQAHLDSVRLLSGSDVEFTEDDVLIGQRIQRMQKTVPLEYNHRVKAYLDKYVSRNYKPYMEKLLGLSAYYFPIYETIFDEMGIPEEVKYLSVVESSLNPHTLSTAGALGPWQFIYGTAKIYDLSMDGMYDERKDVFSSTYAVSQYLSEAYNEFNDWLLALASYNCGRGCVRRAIARSGMTDPTFWELSPYLPQETRNYIPKYVAMTYALTHADIYDLSPATTPLQTEYEVLMVDKHIDLNNVANAVNHPVHVLKEFNPAFKKNIVNGTAEKPKRLIIPRHDDANDSLLYLALNNQVISPKSEYADVTRHRVRKGETLAVIARKYGVTVPDLLAWNNLSSKSSITGKTLLVEGSVDPRMVANVNKAKTTSKTSAAPQYVVHTVRKGDTLSGIASRYKGASISRLKADNNIKGSHLSIGQKVKIYQGKG